MAYISATTEFQQIIFILKLNIPGMLKRIGLAIVVMVLSLVCTFVMDLVVHLKKAGVRCKFQMYVQPVSESIINNNFPTQPLYQNIYFFTSQHVLSAVFNMLLDIAVLEFICSQSPYSMKGLLLGIFFSVKSLFQGIATDCFYCSIWSCMEDSLVELWEWLLSFLVFWNWCCSFALPRDTSTEK